MNLDEIASTPRSDFDSLSLNNWTDKHGNRDLNLTFLPFSHELNDWQRCRNEMCRFFRQLISFDFLY